MAPVRLMVIGAGNRGQAYSKFAEICPDKVQIVGVAEPREWHRNHMAKLHNIPEENIFTCWTEAVKAPKFCDGVIIATPDALHVEPAVAFAKLKYNILLEKPMAPNAEGCQTIYNAAKENGIIMAVCHVLRYTQYSRKLKEIIDSGVIGEIIAMQHYEPVGYFHQAHSFVRGNWRNEEQSSPMLLQKSCHDLDWMRYIMGKKSIRVSSFGSLKHFKKSEQPEGAADRCLDCPAHIEQCCPYSAKKIYYGFYNKGFLGWPLEVVTEEPTAQSIEDALRNGPYGRCVYACDNDVVDNQVVNVEFEGGAVASFLMTAFCPSEGRKTTIHGTKGYIQGDSNIIKIFDYLTDTWKTVDSNQMDNSILSGHGGGDGGIMSDFVEALAHNDASRIISGPDVSLETHLSVFAAEKARKTGTVQDI